jgi:hypothetical protein
MAGTVGEYTISCDAECKIPPYHEKMRVDGFKLGEGIRPGFGNLVPMSSGVY